MKRNLIAISACAAVLAVAAGCAKLIPDTTPSMESIENEGGDFSVTFYCEGAGDTKTGFHDGDIWWTSGDEVRFMQFYETENGNVVNSTSSLGLASDREVLGPFTTKKFTTPPDGTTAAYISLYPNANYKNYYKKNGVFYPVMVLPALQTPTVDSFDPMSDILISTYMTGTSLINEFQMSYTRPCSIGKIKICNLPSSENVDSVRFSAIKDGKAVTLAGRRLYDLVEGDFSTIKLTSDVEDKAIVLDYTGQELKAAGANGFTAYFCCYPFELSEGDSFKVEVFTQDGNSYAKNATIPGTDALPNGFVFERGHGSVFTVDMTTGEIGCNWFNIKQKPSSSLTGSNSLLYYSFSSPEAVSSVDFKVVSASDYRAAAGNLNSLLENASSLSSSTISTINSGKDANMNGGLAFVPDSDYYVVARVVSGEKEIVCSRMVHTETFGFTTATSSTAGKFTHTFYGVGLKSVVYLAVEASKVGTLNNSNCRTYFDNNRASAVSLSASTVNSINAAGAAGSNRYTISPVLESGVSCVDLVLATMEDGTTKFCWKSQISK